MTLRSFTWCAAIITIHSTRPCHLPKWKLLIRYEHHTSSLHSHSHLLSTDSFSVSHTHTCVCVCHFPEPLLLEAPEFSWGGGGRYTGNQEVAGPGDRCCTEEGPSLGWGGVAGKPEAGTWVGRAGAWRRWGQLKVDLEEKGALWAQRTPHGPGRRNMVGRGPGRVGSYLGPGLKEPVVNQEHRLHSEGQGSHRRF